MANRLAPEPWRSAMRKAGLVDPRNDEPSMTQLAREAGVAVETVRAIILGLRENPGTDQLTKIAAALEVDVRKVSRWAGVARETVEAWVPPAEADLLSRDEQDAIARLIRVMAASKPKPDSASVTELPRPPRAREVSEPPARLRRVARKGRVEREDPEGP